MPRIMRDSTNPEDIPTDGTDLVAGYLNGAYAWPADAWARFPAAGHVTIDVTGGRLDADVLDVEAGDASVHTAVRWVQQKYRLAHDYPPVIYCDRETRPQLIQAMDESRLSVGVHYRLWIATLDGTAMLADMTGVVAVQSEGQPNTGGHYDESIVYDDSWKPTAWPVSLPAWPGEYLELREPMLHDDNVRTWQQRMAARGWSIAVDGWYGGESQAVCVAFQKEKGLQVDGIVGPETWDAAWTAPIT